MDSADKKSLQVTTYLPKSVHDQLKVWMDDNYQRSVSQAVSLIVEHFLKKDGRPLGWQTRYVQNGTRCKVMLRQLLKTQS